MARLSTQELRKNKRRLTKAERQGLFSGLLYCSACGGNFYFVTCKSFDGKQDHYVCSKYKSGRGDCSAHYIREDVLRELVLERIQAVNEYIKKIIIHAPDKSGGKRRQKVEIIFNFVDEVEIPVLTEPMIAESTLGRRKTA